MNRNKIFLSYRRSDVPGYVARLEDDLESAFGEDRIFRDVEDIKGGSSWKQVIDRNLQESGALILIIGPRWEEIWKQRIDDPVNYVALELEQAREQGIVIIPVTIGGTSFSRDFDPKPISWIKEKQIYDISDKQGRWKTDVEGLIRILGQIKEIGPVPKNPVYSVKDKHPIPGQKKKTSGLTKWALPLVLLLGIGIWFGSGSQPEADQPIEKPIPDFPGSKTLPSNVDRPKQEAQVILANKETPVLAEKRTTSAVASPRAGKARKVTNTIEHPDISGTWVSKKDATVYYLSQIASNEYTIVSPGYATGTGAFKNNVANKFVVTLDGIGYGEFDLANDQKHALGWMVENGSTAHQNFDTLVKVE